MVTSIPGINANVVGIYKNQHVVAPQLNGSQGEHTGTDDLDDGLKQLAGVAPLEDFPKFDGRKITAAHKHQKKVNGGRNPEYNANHASAARRVKEAEQKKAPAVEQQPKPEKKQRPFKRVICMDAEPFGWDGKHIYLRLGNGTRNVSTGKVCESQVSNTLFNRVKSSGVGFVDVYTDINDDDDLTELSVLTSPWRHDSRKGGFIHEGMSFTDKKYLVFIPAFEMLKKKFASTIVSESMANGMLAALQREFCSSEHEHVLLDTVFSYVHMCHEVNHRVNRVNICKTKVVVKDRIDEKYLSVLNITRCNEEIVKFESQECQVADTYAGRTDCLVTFKKRSQARCWTGQAGFSFDRDIQESYPFFDTMDQAAKSDGYYRSQFLSFDGNNVKPFITYSVNAWNACKALKRMCAARESQDYDHYLSSLQYSAYAEVISRLNDVDSYIETNQAFFDAGRLTPQVKRGKIESFIVGSHLWVDKEVENPMDLNGPVATMRRQKYITPYLTRCGSDYSERCVNPRATGLGDLYYSISGWDMFSVGVGLSSHSLGFTEVYSDVYGFGPALRPWMQVDDLPCFRGDAYELNAVHQRMAVGFGALKERHSPVVVQEYADSHPNWIYLKGWENYLTMMDCRSGRDWHASITHVKKMLRQMFVNDEVVHTPTEIMVKTVNAKVKKEFAKFGKVPRLFVTYDAGCMFANELPEYSKICLDGSYTSTVHGVTVNVCIFAKPGSEKLKKEMNECINAMSKKDYLNVLIYSDDSVWTGNINGIDFAFNVDISSCDSGNKAGVFGLVYDLLCNFRPDLALGLVNQCAKTINLVNPEDKDEIMQIEMATFFEGSGTVLTTILNHVAMYMIGQAATHLFGCRRQTIRDWSDIEKLIIECGVCFGHVLTVDACIDGENFCPEKIQFLKRSPIRTVNGDYIPCMNYGPLFRSFGSVEGDLVAEMVGLHPKQFCEMGWGERWDLFASRVVAGLVNEPHSLIMDALRERYPLTPRNFDSWSEVSYGKERVQFGGMDTAGQVENGEDVLDEVSLARRYDISLSDIEALVSQIKASQFGDVFPSTAVGAFFSVDYGVGQF